MELFFGHFTQDTDGQTGAREGLAPYQFGGDAQFFAYGTDFILEQFPQGFDEAQFHVFGQAAHIVVAFDGGRSAGTAGFHHVRINGPLDQEVHVTDLFGFFFEDPDEFFPDDLRFFQGR